MMNVIAVVCMIVHRDVWEMYQVIVMTIVEHDVVIIVCSVKILMDQQPVVDMFEVLVGIIH
jgi:hypothetical protein